MSHSFIALLTSSLHSSILISSSIHLPAHLLSPPISFTNIHHQPSASRSTNQPLEYSPLPLSQPTQPVLKAHWMEFSKPQETTSHTNQQESKEKKRDHTYFLRSLQFRSNDRISKSFSMLSTHARMKKIKNYRCQKNRSNKKSGGRKGMDKIQSKTYVLSRLDSCCRLLSLSASLLALSNACALLSSLILVTSS